MKPIDPVSLARNLIRARRAAGLTQVNLAKRAGKSPTTVSTLESGKVERPHLGTILDLADALGVEPEDLLGEDALPKDEAPRPHDNGQRRSYPYPWMAAAFSELLSSWTKTVEQGYSPEHCRCIAAGALDALDAVVPPLAAAWDALPEHERREREELRRELLKLAREAYEYFEQNAEADVLASTEAHREEIREDIRRRTRAIA